MKLRVNHRAFSTMELLISVAIVGFITAIVVPSTIFLARAVEGIRTENYYQKDYQLFMGEMALMRARATNVELLEHDVDIKSDDQVLIEGFDSEYLPDATSPTGFTYIRNTVTARMYVEDEDNNPQTIADNRLMLFEEVRDPDGNLLSQSQKKLLEHISPSSFIDEDTGDVVYEDYFVSVENAGRPYVLLNVRVGDRTIPSNPADDNVTGPSYQGYVMEYIIIPQIPST